MIKLILKHVWPFFKNKQHVGDKGLVHRAFHQKTRREPCLAALLLSHLSLITDSKAEAKGTVKLVHLTGFLTKQRPWAMALEKLF